jgi:hypothetical protein
MLPVGDLAEDPLVDLHDRRTRSRSTLKQCRLIGMAKQRRAEDQIDGLRPAVQCERQLIVPLYQGPASLRPLAPLAERR